MNFEITEAEQIITLRLVGTAPAGSEGFRWAEGALSEFRRRLASGKLIKNCRLDFSRLVYRGGDFVGHFVILPIHLGLDTRIVGSPEIEVALNALLSGVSYRYRVVCA